MATKRISQALRVIAMPAFIALLVGQGSVEARVFGVTRTYGDSPAIARAKAEIHRRQNTVSPTIQRWHQQNIERQRHEQYMEYLRLLHAQRMEHLRALQRQQVR